MKTTLFLAGIAATFSIAAADCGHKLPVSGAVAVPGCDAAKQRCREAGEALKLYLEKTADDANTVFVMMHASPWRLYDGQHRILTVEEMAEKIRPAGQRIHRVVMRASWSGVRPDAQTPSLAERLATSLKGIKVEGADGFLWLSKSGEWRTTRQAFTERGGGRYEVADGEDVMVALVVGWLIAYTDQFAAKRDGRALAVAGAAWDIFGLCPARAQRLFEAAAEMGDPLGAYNAAAMLLEKGGKDDIAAARDYLTQASRAGDAAAAARLKRLSQ